jgi:hypothetical protein
MLDVIETLPLGLHKNDAKMKSFAKVLRRKEHNWSDAIKQRMRKTNRKKAPPPA